MAEWFLIDDDLIQVGRICSGEFFSNALPKIRKFLRSANLEDFSKPLCISAYFRISL